MMNRRLKIGMGIAILFGTVVWLAMSGIEEGKSYYKTADEYVKMTAREQKRPIRLMGDVVVGSIQQDGDSLRFTVALNGASVPVVYRGRDPVPDTFKDGVSVLVEGSLSSSGMFEGKKIQAKCASKYEADPAKAYAAAKP